MPCYYPIHGFMTLADGFTMSRRAKNVVSNMTVPCGQCIGCRLEKSRQWAIRCVHEASMHKENSFITLTYDDENLPYGSTLQRSDFQKFMKRLRKKVGPTRSFYCGEYGETTERPHYHAILFGYKPSDPSLFSSSGEIKLYESPTLTKIWGLGHASFGEATFESAAYVARYITKKITGDKALEHYRKIDPETGEIIDRTPEFNGMSRRPGIGLPWLEKYGQDTYSKDEVILRGKKMKPPRAYDKLFAHTDPSKWHEVNLKRAKENHSRYHPTNLDPEIRQSRRDHAGDKIAKQKLQQRNLK